MVKLSLKQLKQMIREAVHESLKEQGGVGAVVGARSAPVGSGRQLSTSGGGAVAGAKETEGSLQNRFKAVSKEMGKYAGALAANPFHTDGVAINKKIGQLQDEMAKLLDQMGR